MLLISCLRPCSIFSITERKKERKLGILVQYFRYQSIGFNPGSHEISVLTLYGKVALSIVQCIICNMLLVCTAEAITFYSQAKYWKQYVEAYMVVNNDDATKQIFSRCLLNCLHIPLWYVYFLDLCFWLMSYTCVVGVICMQISIARHVFDLFMLISQINYTQPIFQFTLLAKLLLKVSKSTKEN